MNAIPKSVATKKGQRNSVDRTVDRKVLIADQIIVVDARRKGRVANNNSGLPRVDARSKAARDLMNHARKAQGRVSLVNRDRAQTSHDSKGLVVMSHVSRDLAQTKQDLRVRKDREATDHKGIVRRRNAGRIRAGLRRASLAVLGNAPALLKLFL